MFLALCHLVDVLAMRSVAAGSRGTRPADEAGILKALAARHPPVAGIGGAAGARLVETWHTDRQDKPTGQTVKQTGRQ